MYTFVQKWKYEANWENKSTQEFYDKTEYISWAKMFWRWQI